MARSILFSDMEFERVEDDQVIDNSIEFIGED